MLITDHSSIHSNIKNTKLVLLDAILCMLCVYKAEETYATRKKILSIQNSFFFSYGAMSGNRPENLVSSS